MLRNAAVPSLIFTLILSQSLPVNGQASESLNLQRPALMTHSDHAPNDLAVARSVDPPASRQRLNDRQTSPFWRVCVLLCWHRQNEGLVPYQDRDLLAIRPEEETDKVAGRVRNPIGDLFRRK